MNVVWPDAGLIVFGIVFLVAVVYVLLVIPYDDDDGDHMPPMV